MPDIPEYARLTGLFLEEAAKYFALLLFAVLAIRLWRRAIKVSRERKAGDFLAAALATVLAAGIGYWSICHSMSLMYSHFGMQAFQAGKLGPAFSLFQTSSRYRKNTDALGGMGVCALWAGHSAEGIHLLDEAKTLRKGKGSSFENFYEGLYHYFQGDTTDAVPLLEAASSDPTFLWSVTKLFATIQLDQDRPQEAARLMRPFMQAEVTEDDQAYVVASLDLAAGKKAEAQALVDKFLSDNPQMFWKVRLEKLRTQIQKQTQ